MREKFSKHWERKYLLKVAATTAYLYEIIMVQKRGSEPIALQLEGAVGETKGKKDEWMFVIAILEHDSFHHNVTGRKWKLAYFKATVTFNKHSLDLIHYNILREKSQKKKIMTLPRERFSQNLPNLPQKHQPSSNVWK